MTDLRAHGMVPLAEMPGLSRAARGIPLCDRRGRIRAFTVVDAEDAAWAAQESWHFDAGYAEGSRWDGKRVFKVKLHREIVGLRRGDPREVDHISRDTLDNRRENLRVVRHHQNAQNQRSVPGSSSRYRGVYFYRQTNRWAAEHRVNGKRHHLGYFATEQAAAEAAADFRRRHMPFATD